MREAEDVKTFLRAFSGVIHFVKMIIARTNTDPLWRYGALAAFIVFMLTISPKLAGMGALFALGNFIYDLKNELTTLTLSNVAARTSTVTGSAVDLLGYIGKIKILQIVGTVSGTTPTLDGKIQDSADGSTGWADVTGATFTQATASDDVQSIGLDTRAVKRYIRYVGTIGGTTPSFAMGVVAEGQKQTK